MPQTRNLCFTCLLCMISVWFWCMIRFYLSLVSLLCPTSVGRGYYEMTGDVRLSVCLSVCRVPRPQYLTRERKGLRKSKIDRMEAHHTGNPLTYLEIKRSKVNLSRSPGWLMLSQTMHHTQAGELYNFLKISLSFISDEQHDNSKKSQQYYYTSGVITPFMNCAWMPVLNIFCLGTHAVCYKTELQYMRFMGFKHRNDIAIIIIIIIIIIKYIATLTRKLVPVSRISNCCSSTSSVHCSARMARLTQSRWVFNAIIVDQHFFYRQQLHKKMHALRRRLRIFVNEWRTWIGSSVCGCLYQYQQDEL